MMIRLKRWENNLDFNSQNALFIEPHPDYPLYFLVSSLEPLREETNAFLLFDSVHTLKFAELQEVAELDGYEDIIMLDGVEESLAWINNINDVNKVDINVILKKFQLQGFNLTKDLPSAIINWSTGTGKSVYGVTRAKYLLETNRVDKVIVVSKAHNMINWRRTFDEIGNLEAWVAEGRGSPVKKRDYRIDIYNNKQIFIINYEKLRLRDETTAGRAASGDGKEIMSAVKGKRVFWIWDEMPTKMKNMGALHFKGANKVLKSTKENYQVMLSATPIEVSPEDLYTCMKLLDPSVWPNVDSFRNEYARSFSTFSPWQVAVWDSLRLKEMGMKLSHMTHQANKYRDPAIRAEFPEEHWEDVYIDMSEADRKIYKYAVDDIANDLGGDYNSIIAKMSVLQMICNNPLSVGLSDSELAQMITSKHALTDKNCMKLLKLKDMLDEIDGKIVLFSSLNQYGSKMLANYLVKWGHSFVLYSGSIAAKQTAQDKFKNDPAVKVFLSSDQGSDSINLQEATTVINYDLPWNYSTLEQRVNRINRITSTADHVFYYNLIMDKTIEERKLKVLDRKKSYHKAVFDSEIGDQAEILATTSVQDLLWILKD